MAKITVHKPVYWNDGQRELSGKVVQILNDHAVVISGGSNYIVATSKLSLKPVKAVKTASCTTIIATKTDELNNRKDL